MFGSLLGTALAPIMLVWLAEIWGWREAFYVAGIPGPDPGGSDLAA